MIPVDVVVAAIITATIANVGNDKLSIYHIGTSDLNPITWGEMKDELLDYWNSTISASKMGKAEIHVSRKTSALNFLKFKRRLPLEAYKRISPFLGKQHEKNATKMIKTLNRGDEVSKLFKFFMTN